MIKAILYDCDGVLIDSEHGLSKIAAKSLNSKFNLPARPEDFSPYIGMGEDKYIGSVVEKYGGIYVLEMKEQIYSDYISLAPEFVLPFDNVAETVTFFKKCGLKQAVASSADIPKVEINLQIAGLEKDVFDAIVTGSDITRKKPDPEIYLAACAKCGISPTDCIVVEDAISGVQSGVSAGMKVIGYTSSVSEDRLLQAGADYCVGNMNELRELIIQLNGDMKDCD